MALSIVGPNAFRQTLTARNTAATESLSFTTALHSYFAAGSETATVGGCSGAVYLDNLEGRAEKRDTDEEIAFGREVDRIYKGVCGTGPVTIEEGSHYTHIKCTGRESAVAWGGFKDAVVWNPHVEKAAKMGDMDDDGWQRFVCVEVANVEPVVLAPGEEWVGTQHVTFN